MSAVDVIERVLRPRREGLAAALTAVTQTTWKWASDLYDVRAATLHFGESTVRAAFRDGQRIQEVVASLVPRTPGEAWEVLATHGRVPQGWVEDPQRVFFDHVLKVSFERGATDGTRTRVSLESGREFDLAEIAQEHRPGDAITTPHPPTVAACVALTRCWCSRRRGWG